MNFRPFSTLVIILAVAGIDAPAARDPNSGMMLPVELSDIGYLQVTNSAVPVKVSKTETNYEIGDSLPLIQKNLRYFVGLAQHDDGFQELVAFRRVLDDGQGTAWVTEQKDLVFGTEMLSETGLFYLRSSETLPIVSETTDNYRVLCERENFTFALTIPRQSKGLTFLKELPENIAKRVQQMERMKQRVVMTPPASGSVLDLATAELESDSLSVDPMSRMLKHSKPEPVVEQNWYESRVADMPELAERVVETPKPKPPARLPRPPQLQRPAAPPPEEAELPEEPEQAIPSVEVATPPPAVLAPPREVAAEVAPKVKPVLPEPVAAPVPPPTPVVKPIAPEPEPILAAQVPPAPTAAPVVPAPMAASAEPPPVQAPEQVTQAPAVQPQVRPVAVPGAAPEQAVSGVARAALRVLLLLVVLTVVFLGAIFLLAKFVNRAPRPTLVKSATSVEAKEENPQIEIAARPPPLTPVAPALNKAPAPVETADVPSNIQSTSKAGTFTGSLHGFHISELIQFLNSSKESGTLTISENNNPVQSRVMFEGGEIYNAHYGTVSGEAAVAEILRFDDGFFVFSRQVVGGCERVIHQSTMSLLMNVHQSIDEATMDPDSFDADLYLLGSTGTSTPSEESQPLFGS